MDEVRALRAAIVAAFVGGAATFIAAGSLVPLDAALWGAAGSALIGSVIASFFPLVGGVLGESVVDDLVKLAVFVGSGIAMITLDAAWLGVPLVVAPPIGLVANLVANRKPCTPPSPGQCSDRRFGPGAD